MRQHRAREQLRLPVAVLACVLSVSRVAALTSDADETLFVNGDNCRFSLRDDTAACSGNVIARQGTRCVIGDSAVYVSDADGKTVSVEVQGAPAYFHERMDNSQHYLIGRAPHIAYDAEQNEVSLTGGATVTHGGEQFAAPRIFYDMDNETVDAGAESGAASGSDRVHAVIPPRNEEEEEAAVLACDADGVAAVVGE